MSLTTVAVEQNIDPPSDDWRDDAWLRMLDVPDSNWLITMTQHDARFR